MTLGEKIFELRKKCGLSQEQLGEKINVTRQTISNWELGETSPNPEQLKLLSKELNISIDELLDNNIQSVLVKKVSNTEKLAGVVLRVLKCLGIIFIIFLVIDIVSLILFTYVKNNKGGVSVNMTKEVELECLI
ncbi:MAG: helix-turn-helix transcriptional regulator [Bacilli bacterium]|nr:helix-turn-helix transcriptional regulator [Bacilli bacterium]